jgi:hypothetical protein
MFDMKRREFTRFSALRRWPICGARNPAQELPNLRISRDLEARTPRVPQADLCDRETCHADAT